MKRVNLILLYCFICGSINSQSISPSTNTEFCPEVETVFTVSVPSPELVSLVAVAQTVAPVVTVSPYEIVSSQGTITFKFKGKFVDKNVKQAFRVTYVNNTNGMQSSWTFEFKKIKSMFHFDPLTKIVTNVSSVFVERCKIVNIPVSFNPVTFVNPFESPKLQYGSISKYEYLLPVGWKLNNGSPSNGSTWIQGSNSVNITTDLVTGDQQKIKIRASNIDCGTGLMPGEIKEIPVSRPAAVLTIGATQGYICSLNGTVNLTVNGVPQGAAINWAVTTNGANAQIIGCSTCPTVQIKRITTANVVAKITATVTNCPGDVYTPSFDLILGTGTNSINFTAKEISCNNGKPYFNGSVQNFPSATNYDWYSKDMSNASNPFVLRQSLNVNTADFPLGNNKGNRYFTIRVIATNPCGSIQSIDAEGLIWAPLCEGGGARLIEVIPNPAISNVTIRLIDESRKGLEKNKRYIAQIQILTRNGSLKKAFKSTRVGETVSVDLNGLPPDIYIVRVFDGTTWTSTQVVKK